MLVEKTKFTSCMHSALDTSANTDKFTEEITASDIFDDVASMSCLLFEDAVNWFLYATPFSSSTSMCNNDFFFRVRSAIALKLFDFCCYSYSASFLYLDRNGYVSQSSTMLDLWTTKLRWMSNNDHCNWFWSTSNTSKG